LGRKFQVRFQQSLEVNPFPEVRVELVRVLDKEFYRIASGKVRGLRIRDWFFRFLQSVRRRCNVKFRNIAVLAFSHLIHDGEKAAE